VRLPRRLTDLATRLEDGEIAVETPGLNRRIRALERIAGRFVSAILFATLLIGGVLARPADLVLGTVLMAASALPLLHAVLAGVLTRTRL
jgi:hypothetical protein